MKIRIDLFVILEVHFGFNILVLIIVFNFCFYTFIKQDLIYEFGVFHKRVYFLFLLTLQLILAKEKIVVLGILILIKLRYFLLGLLQETSIFFQSIELDDVHCRYSIATFPLFAGRLYICMLKIVTVLISKLLNNLLIISILSVHQSIDNG